MDMSNELATNPDRLQEVTQQLSGQEKLAALIEQSVRGVHVVDSQEIESDEDASSDEADEWQNPASPTWDSQRRKIALSKCAMQIFGWKDWWYIPLKCANKHPAP